MKFINQVKILYLIFIYFKILILLNIINLYRLIPNAYHPLI